MSNLPFNSPFAAQFDPDRAQEFIIQSLIHSTINTAELVRVLAVTPTSDRVGFVTVQPLIQDATTDDTVLAQSPIYNVPFLRIQGGVSAVIIDPAINDIGVAIFAQRDITTQKATLQQGPAATGRTYSTGDAIYMGGFLNAAATQYVQFLPGAAGINITSPGNIALNAGGNISITAGGAITSTSSGNTTVNAAAFIVNAPTTFSNTVSGTATGAGKFSFASPITVTDIILPAGSVNTHVHKVTAVGANTNPMNT